MCSLGQPKAYSRRLAKTVRMYWLAALALGLVTALLPWLGLSKLELEPLEEQRSRTLLA